MRNASTQQRGLYIEYQWPAWLLGCMALSLHGQSAAAAAGQMGNRSTN